ncbi:MAG: acetamidase/formamidase family protein, partial [Clostridia bacterium]
INVGGNLDINELGVGSTLYLPVEVEGALFYTGDPHFVQGDGEVALTALEGSLRGTVRLTLLKAGDSAIPRTSESFVQAFGETEDYWIPIGLDADLDEAMKKSVRESINFLSNQFGLDRAKVYAYLSAGVDYEVSQVVDRTKGIHALIPKVDFRDLITIKLDIDGKSIDVGVSGNELYVPLRSTMEALGYNVLWNGDGSIALERGADVVTAEIGSNVYYVNGKKIVTQASPFLDENGVSMLPVSALSQAAGLPVNWSTAGAEVTGFVR